MPRNAAMLAFSAFSELKRVFLVDKDVDIFDMSDVMWAMTTRFQADTDLITIPGCHCHFLDPSNDPAMDPSIRVHGITRKAIFDCTVPFDQKASFQRSQFLEIDGDKGPPTSSSRSSATSSSWCARPRFRPYTSTTWPASPAFPA